MKENKELFPSTQRGIAFHNVVGRGGVLWSASPEVQRAVGSHYTPRAADHLPPTREKFVVYDAEELPESPREREKIIQKMIDQLEYRASLMGQQIHLISLQEAKTVISERALFVPYIRSPGLEQIVGDKVEKINIYGLPGEITALLKNKAESHRLMRESPVTCNHLPEFVITHVERLPTVGLRMLRKIEEMYEEAGVEYEVGLMIRAAEGDGNFGSGYLRGFNRVTNLTLADGERTKVRAGDIVFFPDGRVPDSQSFTSYTSWESALDGVKTHIQKSMDIDKEPRVVLTRYLDLTDSPGLSLVIIDGTPHALPWNGQWQEPGESACTGTTFYNLKKDPRKEELKQKFEADTQEVFTDLIAEVLNRYGDNKKQGINGMINMDIMIPGHRERILWERVMSNSRLRAKYGPERTKPQVWEPRVYNPDSFLIAEINPRLTNWTAALLAVLHASRRQFTLKEILTIAGSEECQVLARDKWLIPDGVSIETARDFLYELHVKKLDPFGGGFILRMPDKPYAGTIGFGPDVQQIYKMAEEALFNKSRQ